MWKEPDFAIFISIFTILFVMSVENSSLFHSVLNEGSLSFNKSQVLMISVCTRVSKNIQHVLSVFKTSSDDLNTLSTGTRRFMFLSGVM